MPQQQPPSTALAGASPPGRLQPSLLSVQSARNRQLPSAIFLALVSAMTAWHRCCSCSSGRGRLPASLCRQQASQAQRPAMDACCSLSKVCLLVWRALEYECSRKINVGATRPAHCIKQAWLFSTTGAAPGRMHATAKCKHRRALSASTSQEVSESCSKQFLPVSHACLLAAGALGSAGAMAAGRVGDLPLLASCLGYWKVLYNL